MDYKKILLDSLNMSGNFNDIYDEFNENQIESILEAMDSVRILTEANVKANLKGGITP